MESNRRVYQNQSGASYAHQYTDTHAHITDTDTFPPTTQEKEKGSLNFGGYRKRIRNSMLEEGPLAHPGLPASLALI